MHDNNRKWLEYLKNEYPEFMNHCRVLELGSGSISFAGTIRPFFDDCEYVGVDIDAGPGVDYVCSAKDFKWDGPQFDTIASFSMLEHDIDWQKSLSNCLPYLRDGGMLFMCWGAEGNLPHMEVWHIVPHKQVIDFLEAMNIQIVDAFFEEKRYGKDCAGAFDLAGIKHG